LERQGQGARGIEARFFRTDGAVRTIAIETAQPTREPALLVRLFQEKLDALADPLDPGFGYDLIRLNADRTEPLRAEATDFDAAAHGAREMRFLVDRLAARFGKTRVLTFEPRSTHIPERAFAAVPAQSSSWPGHYPGHPYHRESERRLGRSSAPENGWPAQRAGHDEHEDTPVWQRLRGTREAPRRPLRLFARPEPIDVTAEVPDAPPQQFRWRRVLHAVAFAEGPERIAPEWWREPGAESPEPTRDYFRVEDSQGRRFWLYREGLYGRETAAPRWFVHGLFP